jgi:hypothetical protein
MPIFLQTVVSIIKKEGFTMVRCKKKKKKKKKGDNLRAKNPETKYEI